MIGDCIVIHHVENGFTVEVKPWGVRDPSYFIAANEKELIKRLKEAISRESVAKEPSKSVLDGVPVDDGQSFYKQRG